MAAFFKVCECTTAGLVKVGMMEYGYIFGLVGGATLSPSEGVSATPDDDCPSKM